MVWGKVVLTKWCDNVMCDTRPEPAHCSSISTTPAEQTAGCHQVPRLPRETTEDVTKCRGATRRHRGTKRVTSASPLPSPSAAPATASGCGATRRHSRTSASPPPPHSHKTQVDVNKCHACHVKRRRMSPSAAPATQKLTDATKVGAESILNNHQEGLASSSEAANTVFIPGISSQDSGIRFLSRQRLCR